MFFAERSRTRGFRSGRQCTLFISKINISMKITKLLFPPAGERKEKTAESPRAPSLRRADASQALKYPAAKRRRCLTSLRNGGRRRAPTALPFLPTIRRFPALPHKKSYRRLRLFPKRRTSPCRPSPEARPSPFRRTFFGARAAILHSAFPRSRTTTPPLLNISGSLLFSVTSDSAEILQLPARRASALPLRSPPRLPASATSTPCAAEFPPLSLPPNGSATYAPNLPCPVPGENLCNSPPAARPSTPSPIRRPIRREAADPRRPRHAAKFPGPLGKISPDTRRNPPGPSTKSPGAELLLFAFSAATKKARLSP